jgi:quinol monooxygenase YgiN
MPRRRHFYLFWGLVLLMAASIQPAPAQQPAPAAPAGPVYVITYLEVGAASAAKAAAILRKLSAASRKEDGSLGFVALREHARPGRFAIVEGWKDKAALDKHAAAAKPAFDQLQPLEAAPPDVRTCNELAMGPAGGRDPMVKGTFYVVTHVDVPPPSKEEAIGLVKQLAEDSRKDDGNLRFDVVQQSSRPNHMEMVEAWRDRTARDAHVMAEHTRAIRTKLTPLHGALFDERLYEPVR